MDWKEASEPVYENFCFATCAYFPTELKRGVSLEDLNEYFFKNKEDFEKDFGVNFSDTYFVLSKKGNVILAADVNQSSCIDSEIVAHFFDWNSSYKTSIFDAMRGMHNSHKMSKLSLIAMSPETFRGSFEDVHNIFLGLSDYHINFYNRLIANFGNFFEEIPSPAISTLKGLVLESGNFEGVEGFVDYNIKDSSGRKRLLEILKLFYNKRSIDDSDDFLIKEKEKTFCKFMGDPGRDAFFWEDKPSAEDSINSLKYNLLVLRINIPEDKNEKKQQGETNKFIINQFYNQLNTL